MSGLVAVRACALAACLVGLLTRCARAGGSARDGNNNNTNNNNRYRLEIGDVENVYEKSTVSLEHLVRRKSFVAC